MGKFITQTLPHDLPQNWSDNQYVTPGGVEVGLTEQHGFNYLMKQVNNAQKAINELDEGVDRAVHVDATNILRPDTCSFTSVADLLTVMHSEGKRTVMVNVGVFADLPADDWAFQMTAFHGEGDLWTVQLLRSMDNLVYYRQFMLSAGWLQPEWYEVLHTGNYQRLTGLAPASLE